MGNRKIQEITLDEMLQIASIEFITIGAIVEFKTDEDCAFIRYSLDHKQHCFFLFYRNDYIIGYRRQHSRIGIKAIRYLLNQGFTLPLPALIEKSFVIGNRDVSTIGEEELMHLGQLEGAIRGMPRDINIEKSESTLILKYKKGRSYGIWKFYLNTKSLFWSCYNYSDGIGMRALNYLLEQNFKVW